LLQKKALTLVIFTLCLALLLGITQVASATGWRLDENMPAFSRTGNPGLLNSENWTSLGEKLNLSAEQSQQLKALHKKNYEATKELRANLQDAMFDLRQLGFDKNPDQAAVDAKIQEANRLRAQLNEIRRQNRESMKIILTPEQQEHLKNMKTKCRPDGRGHGKSAPSENNV